MSAKVFNFKPTTYNAKLFTTESFHIAGTLEGFIDVALMDVGTRTISCAEARQLANALQSSIQDVNLNCRFEKDSRLIDPRSR